MDVKFGPQEENSEIDHIIWHGNVKDQPHETGDSDEYTSCYHVALEKLDDGIGFAKSRFHRTEKPPESDGDGEVSHNIEGNINVEKT